MKKDLIQKAYEEYKKCLKSSEEGKFEYSEKLTELVNKIAEASGTSDKDIIGMLEERKEREEIVKDSKVEDKVISKSKIEASLRKVLTNYLLKLGYPQEDIDEWLIIEVKDFTDDEGNKGIHIQIRNEFVAYYELPESVDQELDKIVAPGYFEPYDSMTWDAYLWHSTLGDEEPEVEEEDYEELVRHASHPELFEFYEISPASAELFEDVYSYLQYPLDDEWIIHPDVLKDSEKTDALYRELRKAIISELNQNEYVFDTEKDKHYGEHSGTEEVMDLFAIDKHITFDSGSYIYQFPASMKLSDFDKIEDYNLKLLGKVGENGFQPGDYIVQGSLKDLEKYCDEILGYEMHPDFLYKPGEFCIECIEEE